ncbi:MAG: molybdopterin-dependent oxidoreductase [Dehalococcoidales bacterium]|nr:molybdopterin-dependent oxidoreductase [Dehalococcoidales bacterium]
MSEEKSFIKGLGFCGNEPLAGSNAAVVDTAGGRIVRIRPLHFDWKYRQEEFRPWRISARGKIFDSAMKTLLPPFSLAYKKRVYSPNRIKYPLVRIDWDPAGERNTGNRGKSRYKRISWDEAASLIASELTRIKDRYGPCAVLSMAGVHGETKALHYAHGTHSRLLRLFLGDYTRSAGGGPDSWEGWFWGAEHVWGMTENVGEMAPLANCVRDIAENTQMILFWGCDPETTPLAWDGQQASRICYWWSDLGIKSVYICPDLNYGAAVHADKWIPVYPNTDASLHLAVSWVWITENSFDRQYVETHTSGFEHYRRYVLGEEDGIAKTPAWASPLCGVPEWTIKALARNWASMNTSIAHGNGGSYIRGPYAHEPARLEVLNLAMQAVGKPGRHQVKMIEWNHKGNPSATSPLPRPALVPDIKGAVRDGDHAPVSQMLPPSLFAEGILGKGTLTWYFSAYPWAPVSEQFKQYTYPAGGCSRVHMVWSDSPCWLGCAGEGRRNIQAIRSPEIECVITQHPWMENGCLYSDIILPVNTKLEEEDLGSDIQNGQYCLIFKEEKCIEAIGESKSDYEAVAEVAKKLGLYEQFTGGKSDQELIRDGFEGSGVQELIGWEEFCRRGYYVVPTASDWEEELPGMKAFEQNPQAHPLSTPSGKIEFYSSSIADHFPADNERAPVPQWIAYGESQQESRLHSRSARYPLLLVSNHGKWRVHAEHDDIPWTREIPMCKVRGADGYLYEPVWINPRDAAERNIRDGDVVRIFNHRGAVLGGARVTQRIMTGAVSQDHGSRHDPLPGGLDRGGSNNLLSPHGLVSRNCLGVVTSGFLVEIEKVEISELNKRYPGNFHRPYDQACGMVFEDWIES